MSELAQRLGMSSVETTAATLAGQSYISSEELATALFLAAELEMPLLLEGEPGVGKTEVAVAVAAATSSRLIRLQGHEGLDLAHALYDWDHARQLLAIRAAEAGGAPTELYDERFLIRRPLLEALEHDGDVVLLVDEIDRTSEEFEALLLELLSVFQVTIPELGTIAARRRPLVVLTSNRTRELHDALKRRCVYHWVDYPDPETERRIVEARIADLPSGLADRLVEGVGRLRAEPLYKPPGVGETIAWARAVEALPANGGLDAAIGTALKVREDIEQVRGRNLLDGI